MEIKKTLHKLVKKVSEGVEKRRYNTAIASMMEFTNFVQDMGGILGREELQTFLKLLAPFAPHVTEELWSRLATTSQSRIHDSQSESGQPLESIHLQPWPTYNPAEMSEEFVQMLVQINGKLRDKLLVDSKQSKYQSAIEKLVLSQPKVQKFLEGKTAKNVIFVPGRLINFVI